MEAIIYIIIALGLSFGGGTYFGYSKSKKHSDKMILQIHEENKLNNERLTEKIDSLQGLPAKVDTILVFQEKIVQKTDTLILTSKKILDNTEIIKEDVKDIKAMLPVKE